MRYSVLLASIALSACTSVEALRPDMEARVLPSRADEVAYINGLREAYATMPARQDVPCYTGENLRPFRPKFTQGYREWDEMQETAGYAGQCIKYRDNPGSEAMRRYVENGFGLTDLYCQRYFIIATQTRQSRRMQRESFQAGDVLVNAVMLALGSPTPETGLFNSGFEAIDSTYENIDDAFVVAPTREDVRKLVHAAQQKFRADVFATDSKEMPASYPSARSVIERYAGLCSYDGMRQLVADAVKGTADDLNDAAGEVRDGDETTTDTTATGTATESPPATENSESALEAAPPVPVTPDE